MIYKLASLACAIALTFAHAPAAVAAKIKLVSAGPVTTYSLPFLVALKKGWLDGLEVEDLHVTGDANTMRVLLSGNADVGVIGTLNVFASIHSGASIRAIHSWQPIGDYSLVLATGKGTKLEDLVGKTFATSGPGALPDQLPRLVMRKHGIDESSTRFVQVGGHAARLQAVIGGRADATLINTVTALKGVQENKVTVLTRLSTEFPGLGYIWSVVRAESLDKPDMAAAFQTLTEGSILARATSWKIPTMQLRSCTSRFPILTCPFSNPWCAISIPKRSGASAAGSIRPSRSSPPTST
jgi:ABC-type nitrate/sulfonate/bicarbonate transport system substrate-binding protein